MTPAKKQVKFLHRNTALNEKPAEEEFTFTPPINEPPRPVYTPAFFPLEESEDEGLDEAVTTHTTMEVKTINTSVLKQKSAFCKIQNKHQNELFHLTSTVAPNS